MCLPKRPRTFDTASNSGIYLTTIRTLYSCMEII